MQQKPSYLPEQQHYQQLQQLLKYSYNIPSDLSLYVEIDQIYQWIRGHGGKGDGDRAEGQGQGQGQEHGEKGGLGTKPLLITSGEYGGKKMLICQLVRWLDKNRSNCFVISEFASVTPYYSEILYKITMQLRNILGINQKVQLNQQKLRQYFRYWLQVADEKIEKDYLGYHKQEKRQGVIIIQGVDKVVDNKNQFVRPSFWLPDVNLKNLKIILTAQNNTSTVDCLLPTVSQKIEYLISDSKIQAIKQKLYKQNASLRNFRQQTHFSDLKIALKILQSNPKFEITEKDITFHQFLTKFILFLSNSLGPEQNICRFLGCLIWNKKGLSKNTIRRSFKFPTDSLQKLFIAFKDIIIQNSDTYMIISRKMRSHLSRLITQKLSPQSHFEPDLQPQCQPQQIKKKLHSQISKSLKRENITVNCLEQMIYHLSHSHNYTELKELLSRIENFLLLYTPLTKHLLCVCWFQLEIQFQYDPVFQYNKAIQRFLNHYYPSPQDTFKIIFQLSLFFKEYSEFQNTKTPQFRHPPIRGQVDQLKQISIYDELIQMNMYQKCKIKTRENLNETMSKPPNANGNANPQPKAPNPKQPQTASSSQPQPQQKQSSQGKQVQKLNVRIKFHQQKFKHLYLQEMEPYINDFYVLGKKALFSNKEKLLDQDSDDSENQMDQTKIDVDKIKKGLLLKKFSDYCEEEYHRCSQKRSFYYYKQWIWMQFPWICQSLNSHYSQLIDKCVKSPTQYMSIDLQTRLISDAVKIAKIAKQNKKQIYQCNPNNTRLPQQKSSINSNTTSVGIGITNRSKINHKTAYIKIQQKQKQKFELSKLDEELIKNSNIHNQRRDQRASKNHNKSQSKSKNGFENQSVIFMTDLSMNQSYVEDKENFDNQSLSYSQRGKLPNILKCSSLAASKAEKNIDIVDTRQYSLLVTKFDQLKHQNSQLVQKIQLLKLNQTSLKQNNKQLQKQSIRQKIEQLKKSKAKLLKNYNIQQALKSKLQMIIKLCDINKSHGSESADLNNFLNSLKIMVKIQERNLEEINLGCKRMLEDSRAEYRKLKEDKVNLQAKLKKQKNKFEKTLNLSHIPNPTQAQRTISKSKHHSKKRRKSATKQDLKKRNKLDKQNLNIHSQSKMLKQHFNIDISFNSSPSPSQSLSQLQSKMQKLTEIEWKLHQLINQNSEKQNKIIELEQKLNINKGHRQHQKHLARREMQYNVNLTLKGYEDRLACLQKCMLFVDDRFGKGGCEAN